MRWTEGSTPNCWAIFRTRAPRLTQRGPYGGLRLFGGLHARLGPPQQGLERGLALLERLLAQVRAVKLEQVEV